MDIKDTVRLFFTMDDYTGLTPEQMGDPETLLCAFCSFLRTTPPYQVVEGIQNIAIHLRGIDEKLDTLINHIGGIENDR